MSVFLQGNNVTSLTNVVAVRYRSSDNFIWNIVTPGFENFNPSNIAHYAISATEMGSTGVYSFIDPADPTPGTYLLTTKAGSNLAVSDLLNLFWEGNCGYVELPTVPPTGYGPGLTGSGSYTVQITVNDGTNPLPNVQVVFVLLSPYVYTGPVLTNGSGVSPSCLLNGGVWQVRLTCPGYASVIYSLNVVGDTTSPVFSMTKIAISAPAANSVTGYLYTRTNGVIASGVQIYYQLFSGPQGLITGYADDVTEWPSALSDINGLIQIPMLTGYIYKLRRGKASNWLITQVYVPPNAASPFQLLEVLGSP